MKRVLIIERDGKPIPLNVTRREACHVVAYAFTDAEYAGQINQAIVDGKIEAYISVSDLRELIRSKALKGTHSLPEVIETDDLHDLIKQAEATSEPREPSRRP